MINTLIWVAVPAGRDADTGILRANVAVMPRLSSPSLAAAGMASWPPPELAAARFWLDVAATPGAPAVALAATLRPRAEAGLWERYFPASTPIRPDGVDDGAAARTIVVSPTGGDGVAAEQIFREAVAAPLLAEGERHAGLAVAVGAALARNKLSEPLALPPAPPAMAAREDVGLDFHDLLGLLREHPTVQKALGLILMLEIAAPPADLPPTGVVRVRCEGLPESIPPITSPWTAFELSGARFMPGSTDAIDAGMVRIDDATVGDPAARGASGWRVLTVDVDSAPSALREAGARMADAGHAPALPALRTGGISIARIGLGADMEARHRRVRAARVADAATVLDADQLLLGYRLDVQREGDTWRSLSLREASYAVGGVTLAAGTVTEEGHLKAGAALVVGDGVLRTDEIVARWTGWSLAIKRPSFTDPAPAAALDNAAVAQLGWVFTAPRGAQPRLRFGARYRLRLRVADITGGGLALDDPLAERHVTATIPFGRFEPIASPSLAPADDTAHGPGESDADIVLRSDRGLTPLQFAAANPAYPAIAARLLHPPVIAIGMAEQHHKLDGLDAQQSWAIVAPVLTGGDPASRLALPDPAAGGAAAFAAGLPASVISGWPSWPGTTPKRIVAQTSPDPLQPIIGWRGDDLTVALAPAATVVVELSSALQENFEAHMAARLDLNAAAAAAAHAGRNPLITPAIFVRVTHATRKPLRDPTGTLTASREPGATAVTLTPTVALFGVDPASTAKLELSAGWTEADDAVSHTIDARTVRDLVIDRGDAGFAEPVRHEFGDTRHRVVHYTATAISRFRHCFLLDEPDAWFAAALQLPPLSIPSSAAPPVIKVINTIPAFRWTNSDPAPTAVVTHIRDGLLRVELERPWFATGEGEMLAVIVAPDRAPATSMHETLSEIGRDPIWRTGAPPRWLTPDQLTLAAGPPVTITPPGVAGPVLAVPHAVFFDAAQGRWACDIAIDGLADASYAPLVRLVLARYQPASLSGLALSPVRRTAFVPLLPRRILTVERHDGGIRATLAGLGPEGPKSNSVEFVIETGVGDPVADTAPTVLADDVNLPGWHQAMPPIMAGLNAATIIALPAVGRRTRLRVTEIENIPMSVNTADGTPLQRRVVFADIIPLGGTN